MKKVFFLILLFSAPLIATFIEAGSTSVKIIVHPSNPVSTLKKDASLQFLFEENPFLGDRP
ncbi:MAG: hypothetical protein MPW15_19570 [Candidatus Manganitrophus sp.]|nr:hypothetical protein [Candidatus Manganitrophus sp.]